MVTLRPYQPPSFLTDFGALAKMQQLERRGFPTNLRNWRFVTCTTDRVRYPNEEAAYEAGSRRLRKMIFKLRRKYAIVRWWWKLECHCPDELGRVFAHWHLLLDYKRPIDCRDLQMAWGLGRTEIRGVRDSRFRYLFKYVAKGLEYLPDWLLNRTRVRLCQSSPGFFPAHGGREAKKDGPSPRLGADPSDTNTQNNKSVIETIGERIERWTRSAVSRTILDSGRSRYHVWELDGVTWGGLLVRAARLKLSRAMTDAEFTLEITKIETTEQWIQQLPVRYRPALSRAA
jgi:hypothetical protein